VAKKDKSTETEAKATAPTEGKIEVPSAEAPPVVTKIEEDLKTSNREIKRKMEEIHALQEQAAKAREKFMAEREERLRKEAAQTRKERTIPVVVQRLKGRPTKIRIADSTIVIESNTQVLVTREELRRLEGLRRGHVLDLVVGEIKKGAVKELTAGQKEA